MFVYLFIPLLKLIVNYVIGMVCDAFWVRGVLFKAQQNANKITSLVENGLCGIDIRQKIDKNKVQYIPKQFCEICVTEVVQ